METILRALLAKFDHIIVSTEESKELSEVKLNELQASPKTHELRLKLRYSEKVSKQAFQTKFSKKMKEDSLKNNKSIEKWKNMWN